MGAEVFNSFDIDIQISKLVTTTESYTGGFTINNQGNKTVFPKLEITTPDSLTLNGVTNNSQTISLNSISLGSADTLVLDFKKQQYEKNGNSIISSISSIDLIHLEKDIDNVFSFDFSGTLNVDIIYETYNTNSNEKYVESVQITRSDNYKNIKSKYSNKIHKRNKNQTNYNLSISKMPTDWSFYQDLDNDEEFRVSYIENNDYTNFNKTKHLVGVTFDSWDRGFNSHGELVVINLSGQAIDLL